MTRSRGCALIGLSLAFGLLAGPIGAQDEKRPGGPNFDGPPPSDPTGGPGRGGFGPGGFGGVREKMKLVKQFDKDGDNRLNAAERQAAREFLQKERAQGRGPGGPGGPGGRGGFGPGLMLAPQMLSQADKDGDQKLAKEEFTALAGAWFDKLDPGAAGKLSQEQFAEKFGELFPPPQGFGGFGGGSPPGGGRGFGPGRFLGPGLFTAADADKDDSLTRSDLKAAFEKWFAEWDLDKSGSLDEGKIRTGLNAVLPRPPNFGGPRGPGGERGPGGPGFRGRGENQEPPKPGPKVSPAEVKSFPDAPLYEVQTLRTFFLEFENADWEKELADFKNTDVEVPAKLTVDGKTYPDVGVHFRGMSSFMMVGEGRKRSLNLSLDFVHEDQQIGGYRTLNLLNSHEDPTFLRTVLYYQIAREYVPAPKANFARVVINGESWGVYVNEQQFNKDFVKEWFGTGNGARWKVPGSPGGRGNLAYLGGDAAPYQRVYQIKSKDDPKSWADLIRLCKVLNETLADKLEEALAPLLDIDGALKFLALENVLINNDGYWIRTSDYNLYQDEKGRFHIIPYDVNETFARPGGPGFGGGPGGFRPGRLAAPQMLSQADKDGDGKLTREEFLSLADAWYDKLDPEKAGKLSQEQFTAKLGGVLLPPRGQDGPQGFGPPGGGPPGGGPGPQGGPGGFEPAISIGPGLFAAVDADQDGLLTRVELKDTFGKWFGDWDAEKSGSLDEEKLRNGLNASWPRPNFAGPGGPGGGRGPGGSGFGGGPRVSGVELDPLIAASDPNKPLLSKLLAVPSLRARYLGYCRDIAEKWLDWSKLGPLAMGYQSVIAADVKSDTRKLYATEDFTRGVMENVQERGGFGGRETISLKNFVEQRRAFLLNHPEVKQASL